MAEKFNNGRGCHTCDHCYTMMCEGSVHGPRGPRYLLPHTRATHYLLMTDKWYADEGMETVYYWRWRNRTDDEAVYDYHRIHEAEYCKSCAAMIQVTLDQALQTVQDIYLSDLKGTTNEV